jgi:superfamily II DNA or RNA helicase
VQIRNIRTVDLRDAREILKKHWNYQDFRPGQGIAIEAVLAGKDTLVIMPTGGGKSLCYQVPSMLLPGVTIVVSPLISLMKDQDDDQMLRRWIGRSGHACTPYRCLGQVLLVTSTQSGRAGKREDLDASRGLRLLRQLL